jgi:hypothetical protein
VAKKADPKDKPSQPPDVEVFFDGRDCGYWFRVGGRYLKLGAKDVRMHLRTRGLRDDLYFKGLREVDYPLWQAQMERIIDYAGPLAGHRVGIFKNTSGRSFLVTDEATGIWDEPNGKGKPVKRAPHPKWFIEFLGELLGGDQMEFLLHWLRIALASLRRGDFRPGQVVVFAGPSECGKSLLQSIITEVLGGRSANPFRYMMGESQFNYDLALSEHWQIEDPASTTDLRTRRTFGAKLKECTVNRDFAIHQKGKDALLLPIFRRVSISVNDEPENLAVIPPMDASIEDKVMLFKCERVLKALEPFKDAKGELDRKKVWEHVLAQVPMIRAWLPTMKDIPADLRNTRFGIKAWHHPELLAELAGLAPESRLLQLLDAVLFDAQEEAPRLAVCLRALDLEKRLQESSFAFETAKLLKHPGACGTYMARLAKQMPERISKRTKDGYPHWNIEPPSEKKESEQ